MSNLLGGWHLTISCFSTPHWRHNSLQWHFGCGSFNPTRGRLWQLVGFDTASGNKLDDHHYYYARFYRKAGKLFRSRYLGRTLLFTFDPTITTTTRNYSNFQFRPCLLYTLVSGSRGCAREMRMALSQLHFL